MTEAILFRHQAKIFCGDLISRGRPREKGRLSTGALAFSRGSGGTLGNAAHDYKRFRSNQAKGAQKGDSSAPPLPVPLHLRKEKISNSDDEIAAGLGR